MEETGFKKVLKHLYRPSSRKSSLVDVPAISFLMVDGHGDPNTTQSYQEALETLYAVAYALKFMSKKELEKDYTVMPLEGLWCEDMERFRRKRDKSAWLRTMMIMQPQWTTYRDHGRISETGSGQEEALAGAPATAIRIV